MAGVNLVRMRGSRTIVGWWFRALGDVSNDAVWNGFDACLCL